MIKPQEVSETVGTGKLEFESNRSRLDPQSSMTFSAIFQGFNSRTQEGVPLSCNAGESSAIRRQIAFSVILLLKHALVEQAVAGHFPECLGSREVNGKVSCQLVLDRIFIDSGWCGLPQCMVIPLVQE